MLDWHLPAGASDSPRQTNQGILARTLSVARSCRSGISQSSEVSVAMSLSGRRDNSTHPLQRYAWREVCSQCILSLLAISAWTHLHFPCPWEECLKTTSILCVINVIDIWLNSWTWRDAAPAFQVGHNAFPRLAMIKAEQRLIILCSLWSAPLAVGAHVGSHCSMIGELMTSKAYLSTALA